MITISLLVSITLLLGEPYMGEANSQAESSMNWSQSAKTENGKELIVKGRTDEKLIALTFDDGPDETTEQILDVLNQFQVKATFFVVGENCRMRPEVLVRISKEGHEIGNHTYKHPKFRGKTKEQIGQEIAETNKTISDIIGREPVLFRPPGGTVNNNVVEAAKEPQVRIVLWTPESDSKDWINPGVGRIIMNVLKSSHAGNIVLMHDGGGNRSQTLYALPEIIRRLKDRGFTFVTVTELMEKAAPSESDVDQELK